MSMLFKIADVTKRRNRNSVTYQRQCNLSEIQIKEVEGSGRQRKPHLPLLGVRC